MLALALLLIAPTVGDVDMFLTPASQCALVNEIVELDLFLATNTAASLSAIDVILEWDPAEFEFQQALSADIPWFAMGFFNDPDNINVDLQDGDALFTALANPGSPPSLPPALIAVKFRFRVLSAGAIAILPSLGSAETKVVGTVPGQDLTGVIPPPIFIGVTAPVMAAEVVRLGTPPNPDALRPGLTTGPILGERWDPFVDHTTFYPSSLLDIYTVYLDPANQGSIFGPTLGANPIKTFYRSPLKTLKINVPDDCTLVGVGIVLQAASWDGTPFTATSLQFTNALDITIGTF